MNKNQFIKLRPVKLINGEVDLPGSKSISNRALLLASQSVGVTRLINLLDSDDVHHMLFALKKIGINYRFLENKRICEVEGIGKALRVKGHNYVSCFLGNSGVSMRLLTAALCLQKSKVVLTGDSRMKERPIGHLVNALCQGGAKIEYLERSGYPPLQISGGYYGGNIMIKGSVSSQFLSGLLMMAPLSSKDTCVYVDGLLVSQPYIDITLSLMRSFGVNIKHENYRVFYCQGNNVYRSPGDYLIEGDASNASYFLAAAAIRGGTVSVRGIGRNSIQGDIRFIEVLEQMGGVICWGENHISCTRNILNPIDMDMNHIPDAAMTIAVMSLFVKSNKSPTVLRNIYNWRLKESDRLMAMSKELRRVGAIVTEGSDYIKIIAPNHIRSSRIRTYDDHRIAMAFSLLSLSDSVMTILNPSCVNKTFPFFFREFMKVSKFI